MTFLLSPFFSSSVFDHLYEEELFQKRDESGNLKLEFDLPGVKKEDVNISVKDRILEIKAERKDRKYLVERKYKLPYNVDMENLSAKMLDGVLLISVPSKVQEKEKTKIVKIE